jgi:hypothetical protein
MNQHHGTSASEEGSLLPTQSHLYFTCVSIKAWKTKIATLSVWAVEGSA